MQPDIIYEDKFIIVCRKPAGIPTQTNRIGMQDMVSILKNYLHSPENTSAGKIPMKSIPAQTGSAKARKEPYLAVIHRLDQPVEGLLVFAKTPGAARELNRQLTSSGFGKYYTAEVLGVPEPLAGTLENYIVKDGRINTSRICAKETPGAKSARLSYRTLEVRADTSLVEIHLDTGRHHQIRVQFAHFGHPLAGDSKYGGAKNAGTLKLCAYRLEFLHPAGGEKMCFKLDHTC